MSRNTKNSASEKVAHLRAHVAHFWASSSPFFSTSLLFEPLDESAIVKFFDPDGALFNEIEVNFEDGLPGFLDLEPCMAGCKFESGLKHARLEICSTKPLSILARVHTRDWAGVTREAIPCSALRKAIVPFFCQSEKTSVIAILNRLEVPVEVRARLFIGNRSPELIWKIPGFGCRFVDTKLEYDEVIEQSPEAAQGYVRLSVVGDEEVFIHTFEVGGSIKQPRYFSFLT